MIDSERRFIGSHVLTVHWYTSDSSEEHREKALRSALNLRAFLPTRAENIYAIYVYDKGAHFCTRFGPCLRASVSDPDVEPPESRFQLPDYVPQLIPWEVSRSN